MPIADIRVLSERVQEWRNAPALVRGRLPAGVASAWVFVLRAKSRNPAHLHPNSTQYTAAIRGGGSGFFGEREVALRTFDPADPAATIHVLPPGMPHAFAPGSENLVVISFHTVAPEDLVEIEVETDRRRTYVADLETR